MDHRAGRGVPDYQAGRKYPDDRSIDSVRTSAEDRVTFGRQKETRRRVRGLIIYILDRDAPEPLADRVVPAMQNSP